MKKTIILLSLLIPFGILAQTPQDSLVIQLRQNIMQLKIELKNQKSDLSKQLSASNDSLRILRLEIERAKTDIQTIGNDLGIKISANKTDAENQIKGVQEKVSKNTLYWIIAVLAIALLSVILFAILRRKLSKEKTDIADNIRKTQKALEEEGVKLDNKLVDLLATQLQLMKEERKTVIPSKPEEVNHDLALKVADEITRMQKNLLKMNSDIKGVKPIEKGIERLRDNFAANGYEIVNLLNKDFDERMNLDVINFITDKNLAEGKKIISAIIKPQVNYQGVLIQRAQVDVSQN
jgi:hypothetical protein